MPYELDLDYEELAFLRSLPRVGQWKDFRPEPDKQRASALAAIGRRLGSLGRVRFCWRYAEMHYDNFDRLAEERLAADAEELVEKVGFCAQITERGDEIRKRAPRGTIPALAKPDEQPRFTMATLVDLLHTVPDRLHEIAFRTPSGDSREEAFKTIWLNYLAVRRGALRPLRGHPALPEIIDRIGPLNTIWTTVSALGRVVEPDQSKGNSLADCETRWEERIKPLRDVISSLASYREIVPTQKLTPAIPPRPVSVIAADFRRQADLFDDYRRQCEKPTHLFINIEQTAIRTGRLLQEAADAGAFDSDKSWWRNRHSFVCVWVHSSDAEEFRLLWSFAIGTWLVKQHPNRFRNDAGGIDWSKAATDHDGSLIGKDGKVLKWRWYRDGKRLPANWKGNPFDPEFWKAHDGNRYELRLEGEIAKESDFYDESDALAYLRVRAEVYADACRVVADMVAPDNADRSNQREIVDVQATTVLTDVEIDVLKALARTPGRSVAIDEIPSGYAKKATRSALRRLEELRFVAKPADTQRKGVAITEAGLAHLKGLNSAKDVA